MVLEISLSTEADPTVDRTRIRSKLLVDKHVSLQVLLLFEVFVTAFLWACVRLHFVDSGHVYLPLLLLVKLHITDRADLLDLLPQVLNEVAILVVRLLD